MTELPIRWAGLVAFARGFRKVLLELALDAVEFLGVGRRLLLFGNIGPGGRVFRVYIQPLVEAGLGIRLDRLGRAFGLAHAAIDTFVGVDDEHVLALIEAVDGANLDAVHVFALNAVVRDDVGHVRRKSPGRPAGGGRLAAC